MRECLRRSSRGRSQVVTSACVSRHEGRRTRRQNGSSRQRTCTSSYEDRCKLRACLCKQLRGRLQAVTIAGASRQGGLRTRRKNGAGLQRTRTSSCGDACKFARVTARVAERTLASYHECRCKPSRRTPHEAEKPFKRAKDLCKQLRGRLQVRASDCAGCREDARKFT